MRNLKKIVNDILFIVHTGIIFFGMIIGLFVSIQIVILIVSAHRVQFIIFNGCLFSKLQSKFGGIPDNMSYLQYTTFKITGKKISEKQGKYLDYFIVIFAVGLAFVI